MKILVVCQYYYPEPFRISDICEELVKKGHEVTVITGIPNYPMGIIYEGYRNGNKRDEVINGVKVHRCFTIGRRNRAVWRFINYYSYAISSKLYISKLKEDFDAVLVNQLSPVMMASAGIKYKKKHNKKLVMYCLDLWPESLIAGNIERDSIIYKLFYRISKNIYRQADKILIASQTFREYLCREFDIDGKSIHYLPQYAEKTFLNTEKIIQKKDTVDLFFAGNIGTAQSIDTILYAAKKMKDAENLRFHIFGDGSELERCRNLADKLNLKSVIFHGRKPLEDMPNIYAQSDAALITLAKDELYSITVPGKVQSYMAAGKPIIGAVDGEAAKIIIESGCGFCGPAEDSDELAKNIQKFLNSNHAELGENSSRYYKKYFCMNMFIDNLVSYLSN